MDRGTAQSRKMVRKEGREEGRKIEVRAIGTQRSLVAELVNALGDTRRALRIGQKELHFSKFEI